MTSIPNDNFDQFIAGKNCLLKFSAMWCGPCRTTGKTLQKVQDNTGVEIYEVDIDTHSDIAIKYGISSVPTVVCIRDGQPEAALVGARNEKDYMELAEKSQTYEGAVAQLDV